LRSGYTPTCTCTSENEPLTRDAIFDGDRVSHLILDAIVPRRLESSKFVHCKRPVCVTHRSLHSLQRLSPRNKCLEYRFSGMRTYMHEYLGSDR
jgi:hypothetical protein